MDIISKIDMYKPYTVSEKKDMMAILELALFIEEYQNLNEAFDFLNKLEGLASKMGIHVSGSSKGGMIGILWRSGKVLSELMWNLLKAAGGDNDAKQRVIELSKTEVKKEDVLDFLLRLDGLTLHMFTGPIHMLDNLTGWHIWAAVQQHAVQFADKASKALKDLVDVIKDVDDEVKTKSKKLLHGVASVLGLEDVHKAIQSV